MDADTERDFEQYVRTRSHVLFRTAMALTGHRQEAEDLVQTVLARAARRWSMIRTDPDAYLRTALYRQRASWWRRLGRRREAPTGEPPTPAVADETGRVHARVLLVEALRALPPRQRAVLVLHYLEDLPDTEIATILGCALSTVRSQRARALEKLRLRADVTTAEGVTR